MLLLVRLEICNHRRQFGVAIADFGKLLTGSQGGESQPARDIPRYLRLLQQGRLLLDRFVSARYPLEGINDAIAAMRDGATAGRVMVEL